jgi:hypothetical protein
MSDLKSDQNVSDVYVNFIRDARQYAIDARDMFDSCGPSFPPEHWHWREVDMEKLITKVESGGSKLTPEELKTLVERMNWAKTRMKSISFNRFCLYIGEALRGRFGHEKDTSKMCSITNAVDCYLE